MRYTYSCNKCSIEHDVIKSHKLLDREELCHPCNEPMARIFKPGALHLYGFKNNEHFNNGLNRWVDSTKHAEKIAKSMGMEPVGNDKQRNLKEGSNRREY
jgi:hypothetical protein